MVEVGQHPLCMRMLYLVSSGPPDTTAPHPSLPSISSRGSVSSKEVPADTSPATQPVVGGGEGDVESVFDEEGLLFGDSEFSTA